MEKGWGRRAGLPPESEGDLKDKIVSLRKNGDGGRIVGCDIMDMVKNEFKTNYTISGIYNLLSRLSMSWAGAGSVHPRQNRQIRDDFKKTSLWKSQNCCQIILMLTMLKYGFRPTLRN